MTTAPKMPLAVQIEDLDLYSLFLRLLEKPRRGQEHLIMNECLPDLLRELAKHLGLDDVPDITLPPSVEEAESRYLSLFEVGLPAPPCPLNEAPYCRSEPPTRIIRENLLFYRAFGLDLSGNDGELPDHILNQLEFVSYLTRLAEQTTQQETRLAAMTAKRDFIERRLLSWVPKARLKLGELGASPYDTMFALLELHLKSDLITP